VRRTPIGGLALALLLALVLAPAAPASPLLTLRPDGTTFARDDRTLPPAPAFPRASTRRPAPARGPSARAAATKPTVRGELARMLAAGAIDQATHDANREIYVDALGLRSKLSGARRAALGAVLRNLEDVAASGGLEVSRLPALFETVARNRQWWSNGPLLSYGRRVSFQGSPLVWQYYTGEGLQIQWLGTFGKANALWKSRTHDADLRRLLDEAIALAAQRAGGAAFEYLFDFGGGRPPWVSGLAQGTGIQALSRGAIRLSEPRYFDAARSGLGVFRAPPPSGVRVTTPAGAHYLIYSFSPGLRVLNGFTQALNGLHDFALLANDAEGRAMFTAGEAQLRAELPAYDTGAWSRYSLRSDADLSYHKLARDFLVNLCTRLKDDAARAAAPATGGTAPAAAPLADATPYCAAGERFSSYLRRPPVVSLVSRRARAGKPASLRIAVSKPAYVKLAVRRGDRTVAVFGAQVASGRRTLVWPRPRPGAGYEVMLRATDLAGNVGSATGELDVLEARRKRG